VEIVVIEVDEGSATDIDSGRDHRNVVHMARRGAPADTSGPDWCVGGNMSRSDRLRGRAGQRAMTRGKERLARPMGREMKPETPHTPAHAARDFEQLEPNGADGRRLEGRPGEDRAPEVGEQQQGNAVELQSERVGAEPMTTEAVGVDVPFEFFDPVLRRAAVVVPRDEIRGVAAAVGDHKAHVEACAVTSILTRIRRGCGHDFARCRKLVRR
jgi:hypothetical protein